MKMRAKIDVLWDVPGEPLWIKDVGHHSGDCRCPGDPTITNDVEAVVEHLVQAGLLPPGRDLNYIDSVGEEDRILVVDGKFAGFAPVRRPERSEKPGI